MNDDKQRIDVAKWQFERTLGWIASSDAKVGVVVALDTAMLGGLAAAFTASDVLARTTWCYVFLLVTSAALAIAIFCSAMAAIPRMLGPVESMIFFSRVAKKNESDFVSEYIRLTEQNYLVDLVTQIHRNCEIAHIKHMWVRKAALWSFGSGVPWIGSICLLVKL